MNIKHTRRIILMALIVGGAVILAPTISSGQDTRLGDELISPYVAVTALPVLWTAGGLSAGTESAGQAARIASDAAGNLTVVSGPSGGRDLAITSYTANGILRWRDTVSPASGTFAGDWVAECPNGDFVVIGHSQDFRGRPIASTMLRYTTNGARGFGAWIFQRDSFLRLHGWLLTPQATPMWPGARSEAGFRCRSTIHPARCFGRRWT